MNPVANAFGGFLVVKALLVAATFTGTKYCRRKMILLSRLCQAGHFQADLVAKRIKVIN